MLNGENRPMEQLKARVDSLEELEAAARKRYWTAARAELGVDT
jgi:hypothetical protein